MYSATIAHFCCVTGKSHPRKHPKLIYHIQPRVLDAKEAAIISLIPKRSPDLNVLDYSIWSEVERRLRRQELSWPMNRKETRAQFEQRLNRTALRLPASFINKSVCDLKRRCELLYEAKGGLFEEGGRSRRLL